MLEADAAHFVQEFRRSPAAAAFLDGDRYVAIAQYLAGHPELGSVPHPVVGVIVGGKWIAPKGTEL